MIYKKLNYKNLINEFEIFLAENNFDITDIAVNCNTNEKAEIFICILNIIGVSWNIDRPLLVDTKPVTKWGKNEEETCYRVKENNFVVNARKEYYENNNIPVIAFENIFKSIIDELTEISELPEQNNKKKKGFFPYAKKKKAITEDKPKEVTNEQSPPDCDYYEQSDNDLFDEASEPNKTNNIGNTTDTVDKNEEFNETDKTYAIDENNVTIKTVEITETQAENSSDEFKAVETSFVENRKTEKEKIFFPINNPFTVNSLDNRTFRITEQYLRQENINGYWIPCNNEWELSYIFYLYITKNSELQFLGGEIIE